MTERNDVYKCNVCGNIVEVLHAAAGELVCCNKPMELMKERTEDEGQEKHLPVIEATESGTMIKVGSVPHPMENEHHIEWIEIIADGKTNRKFLKPGEQPEAVFKDSTDNAKVREYCNIHGLWRA